MTEIVALKAKAAAVVEQCIAEQMPIIEVLADHVITSEAEYTEACEFLVLSKTKLKSIDAERVLNVAPLNTIVKEINDTYRPALDMLRTMETRLKSLIGAYTLKKQQDQQRLLQAAAEVARQEAAVRQKALEAMKVTDIALAPIVSQAAVLVVEAQAVGPVKHEGISTSLVWKWDLVDADLVDRALCSPDKNKIDAFVKAGGRAAVGLRIYEDVKVIGRTTK